MNGPDQNGNEELCGVFSIRKSMKIGTGATQKRVQQSFNYLVRELEDGNIEIQPLGEDYVPLGNREIIDRERLLADYMPEPALWQEKVLPKMREIQKHLARGDKYRKRGETFTAEYEYNKALRLDERNVRANFGIGLVYLERGDAEKAHEVFERVVGIEAAFEDDHKHLFNEFGINLRKSGLFDDAVRYYRRALELAASDENLHYNLARAYYEKGDHPHAARHLNACLAMNPQHAEAKSFLASLQKRGLA
ncbi:tetratricopeptide repeat protein [Paucidesulfovibrio longus]|uniref:tetratricopeptide repeat protein n=1 Tax=Paucidesulfovibrio longus TaxID=889 RepID=UPI0003B6A6C4|nr:tetratricopeptide repeat protein [Paucidesulfovibrio longus]